MIVSEIKSTDIINPDFVKTLIENVSRDIIPIELKRHFSDLENRQALRETYGDDAYLVPNELRFPVINPNTGDYDCRLIYASKLKSFLYSSQDPAYESIHEQAINLSNQCACIDRMNINIENQFDASDLYELLTFMELDFSNCHIEFDNIITEELLNEMDNDELNLMDQPDTFN